MTIYNADVIECTILKYWEKRIEPVNSITKGCKNFSIPLPPPNVTGNLHMGHAFQQILMDIIVRYKKMCGYNVHWQIGTDHAGIATQLVVEKWMESNEIDPKKCTQDEFLEHANNWKNNSNTTILNQMKRLGLNIDLKNYRFTHDERYIDAVTTAFIKLYNSKKIYRGVRLVNWEPNLQTAISDLEVIHKEVEQNLYYIKYKIESTNNYIIVPTTRPETIFGDTAIAVNINDTRYKNFIGKLVKIPILNRSIPIVGHRLVDQSYGTGAMKITPSLDFLDERIAKDLDLPFICIFDKSWKLLKNPYYYHNKSLLKIPDDYIGLNINEARKKIVDELSLNGSISLIEKTKSQIPICERTGSQIEPLLTEQWFIDTKGMALRAKTYIETGEITFITKNYKTMFNTWVDNIEDWCISRQLLWGHRIPVWWENENKTKYYVGRSEKEIRELYNISDEIQLTQDKDVLDTWFSSSLWTFASLGWPKETEELDNYHPTDLVISGFDIIYFWITRMIMMTLELTNKIPFKKIYLTGLIKDKDGIKMSKSKGNVIDPISLIYNKDSLNDNTKDISESFGADALRLTLTSLCNQSRDIRWSHERLRGYRNFCNKIWNAFQLIDNWGKQYNYNIEDNISIYLQDPIYIWSIYQLQKTLIDYKNHLDNYRFDLALQSIYEYTWHIFCDWHLEFVKSYINDKKLGIKGYSGSLEILKLILTILHPIIPFITDYIWNSLQEKDRKFTFKTSLVDTIFPQIDDSFFTNRILFIENLNWVKEIIENFRVFIAGGFHRDELIISLSDIELLQIDKDLVKLIIKKLCKVDISENVDYKDIWYQNTLATISINSDNKKNKFTDKLKNLNNKLLQCQENLKTLQNLFKNKNFLEKAKSYVIKSKKDEINKIQLEINNLTFQISKINSMNNK